MSKPHVQARAAYRAARGLFRLAEAAPQRPATVLTSSGYRRDERSPNNEYRDEAVRLAHGADPRAVSHLARHVDDSMQSSPREWFGLCESVLERRDTLLRYRFTARRLVWRFDTSGFRLLDAKAKRIASAKASREAEARMLAAAQACVDLTESAVAAMRAAA